MHPVIIFLCQSLWQLVALINQLLKKTRDNHVGVDSSFFVVKIHARDTDVGTDLFESKVVYKVEQPNMDRDKSLSPKSQQSLKADCNLNQATAKFNEVQNVVWFGGLGEFTFTGWSLWNVLTPKGDGSGCR